MLSSNETTLQEPGSYAFCSAANKSWAEESIVAFLGSIALSFATVYFILTSSVDIFISQNWTQSDNIRGFFHISYISNQNT